MQTVFVVLLGAYLLGAIPFGLLIARAFGVKDIRKSGSGNIGATNVWRVAGAKAAVWVYIADIGKGVVAVLIARSVTQSSMNQDVFLVFSGLAAVIGHVFPIYLGFKGGKGVNTALGVLFTLMPIAACVSLLVFIVTLTLTKYVSVGSLLAAASLLVVAFVQYVFLKPPLAQVYVILAICLALIVLMTHRSNINRLREGNENKFSLKSKTSATTEGTHV